MVELLAAAISAQSPYLSLRVRSWKDSHLYCHWPHFGSQCLSSRPRRPLASQGFEAGVSHYCVCIPHEVNQDADACNHKYRKIACSETTKLQGRECQL